MSELTNHIDVILPIALLVLAYALRLFIGKAVDSAAFLKSICELPVDIVFLSLSFVIAFTITHKERQLDGLLMFIMFLIAAILVVFLRGISVTKLEAKNKIWILTLFLSGSLSIWLLSQSIKLMMEESKTTEEKCKTEQVDLDPESLNLEQKEEENLMDPITITNDGNNGG